MTEIEQLREEVAKLRERVAVLEARPTVPLSSLQTLPGTITCLTVTKGPTP